MFYYYTGGKKIYKLASNIIALIITFIYLVSYSSVTFAFSTDLKDIKINDLSNKIQLVLTLTKIPKIFNVDKSKQNEVNIALSDTYLSTDLIKNLDIILNENIRWEQSSNKLNLIIKHKAISTLASSYVTEKMKQIVIDIPKSADKSPATVNTEPKKQATKYLASSETKPAAKTSSVSSSNSSLPAFIADLKNNPGDTIAYRTLAPGVVHVQLKRKLKEGPLFINILDIAPDTSNIEVLPALANEKISGKKSIRTILKERKAIAGVNAGFFKPGTGHPLGTVIIDDELISGPIFDRVTLGITEKNEYRIERIHLTGQIITGSGRVLTLNNVNQPRISSNDYLLYSSRWGWRTPENATPGHKQVAFVNGRVNAVGTDSLPIPPNGYVIVGPDRDLFSEIKYSDKLKLIVSTDPDWSDIKHAIGGGPFLVRDGFSFVDKEDQNFRLPNARAPRTAVGVTKDKHLILVTVDGRKKEVSIGANFYYLSSLMLELGAVDAMNLDGGSSTQMCIGSDIVNVPTISGGARVSNGLIIIPTSNSSTSSK